VPLYLDSRISQSGSSHSSPWRKSKENVRKNPPNFSRKIRPVFSVLLKNKTE
jgi:hypothetical protein